ncbi:inactive tyrosine-protein kinase 7-like isoform X2 [Apostichopus japonicus]|uniref:inactive tyrosine-protein kinase 7-like isoform X2 n=1 Tax=Stichopus japonicus TaxID=307972 RepID=UPI003AB392AC
MLFYTILCLYGLLGLTEGVSTSVQNITVVRGNSVFLNCSSKNNSSRKPIWWFQRKVFYADGLPPEMVDNVYGEVTNTTFSYLKITNFYSGNVGNYTCAFGDITIKTYMLDMKDPTITLLCNSEICPSFLDVNESTDQSFQCYSDQTPLQRKLTWKINDETPSSDKAKYKLIGLDIDVISTLNITIFKYGIFISCTLGNTSKSVSLQVNKWKSVETYGTKELLIVATSTSGALLVVIVLTVCMIAICKTRFSNHSTYNMNIVRGNSLALYCSCETANPDINPIWLFNERVMFANNIKPLDLGVTNIHGEVVNGMSANLHITRFSSENVGNYTCALGEDPKSTYHLHLKDPSVYITYQGKLCPHSVEVMESLDYNFVCYTDQVPPGYDYKWKINNIEITEILSTTEARIDTHKEANSSVLNIKIVSEYRNVSCFMGEISNTVMITVRRKSNSARYFSLFVLAFLIVPITLFVYKRNYWQLRCMKKDTRLRNPLPTVHLTDVMEDDFSSIYGSLPEYDDVENAYEVENSMVIPREGIKLLNKLSRSTVILRWEGILSLGRTKSRDVVISYVEANASKEVKQLWQSCLHMHISFPEHENILKTIGYCKHEGVVYLIQDHFALTTLDACLINNYSNTSIYSAIGNENNGPDYAADIIRAMSHLATMGCSHPGLQAKRILVDSSGRCKLYGFCSTKDARKFLHFYVREGMDSKWTLAPESILFGDYRPASDIWAIGIVLWEVFFGETESLHRIISLDDKQMQKEIIRTCEVCDFSKEKCTLLEMCLRKRFEDRPSVDAVRDIIEKKNRTSTVYSFNPKRFSSNYHSVNTLRVTNEEVGPEAFYELESINIGNL